MAFEAGLKLEASARGALGRSDAGRALTASVRPSTYHDVP
jgi:hypothetical protein